MTNIITVRLQYAVTGNMSAAKRVISERISHPLPDLEKFAGNGFSARCYSRDVNPGEVSGYSNHETFTVGVLLENDRTQYNTCRELAKVALAKGTASADSNAHLDGLVWLADELEAYVNNDWLNMIQREVDIKTDGDSLAHSLLAAALDRVDWIELAEGWLSRPQEEVSA